MKSGHTNIVFVACALFSWFGDFTEAEFSRAGNMATQTVHAVSGSLPAFTHDMEPQLRKLGLPTSLEKGDCQFVAMLLLLLAAYDCGSVTNCLLTSYLF